MGSRTESLKIGDSNILEAKCSVGRHTNLSNGCIVGAGCSLTVILPNNCWIFKYDCVIQVEETLAENSVVYGGGCDRRKAADRPAPQTLQIDFLSKVALVDV